MTLLHEMQLDTLFRRAASGAGSHRQKSSSVSAFLSTLVPCIALAAVLILLFLFLRNKLRRLYAPRTYHDALFKDERTPPADTSFLGWIKNYRSLNDDYILNHQSLDGYLYVRFFKVLVTMSFVGCLITWPVLFPVNATGGGGQTGLDVLSFSNVENPTRYFAHALIAWVFFGWVLFLIAREMLYLVKLRQAYLLSTWNASRISQRTVLFTNVPKELRSHERLKALFKDISQIWLVSDTSDLEDDVDDVSDTALKLEGAEVKLIQTANKESKESPRDQHDTDGSEAPHSAANRVVEAKMRPTHRLKPLIGEKVDTINYCREHLAELLPKARSAQASHLRGKEELVGAVFIEFDSLQSAQAAFALTVYEKPASFVARQMGVMPDEVIWKNLKMNAWDRSARRAVVTLAIYALILFWSIPVAIVGIISNVNYLTANVPFLVWIDDIPSVILGVVTGLLPTILLAVLMILVPIICRALAKLAGAVTLSEVEQQTQSWYFAFQVIQVFLITTFTSGATAVASQIVSNPKQAVPLLANNLPKASNFYISYFVLYGVANASKYLFNIGGLLGVFVLSKFAKTPRKQYQRWVQLSSPSWGSEYPKWTNLGVIAIAYAIISPLVLGFATVGMGLIYLAYRYNMLYVNNTQIDTKGACYARALQQLLVGVYLAELCILGLFGIGIGNGVSSVGPVVLQIVLIIATIAFHIAMRRKLKPLVDVLPLSLLRQSEQSNDSSNAERGDGQMSDHMHPGYHGSHQNGEKASVENDDEEPLGLVSGRPSYVAGRQHTHAQAHDIGMDAETSAKQPLWKRLLMPHLHETAASLSASLNPRYRQPVPAYSEVDAREAFVHPALTQEAPLIWLPKDKLGVSKKEISELNEVLGKYNVEATDEGAVLNEKNKVEWRDESVTMAPLWRERVVY